MHQTAHYGGLSQEQQSQLPFLATKAGSTSSNSSTAMFTAATTATTTATAPSAYHHHLLQTPHIHPPPPHHFSLGHLGSRQDCPTNPTQLPSSSAAYATKVASPSSGILHNPHTKLMQQLGLAAVRSSDDSDPAGSDQNALKSNVQQQQSVSSQMNQTQTQSTAPVAGSSLQQISSVVDDEGALEDGDRGGGGGGPRWVKEETSALIKIRIDMDRSFRDSPLKGPLWEEVSRKLAELGYQRSSKKCKEKFENVYKYYKKSKDGRAGRQDGKSYRFFADMEALFSAGSSNTMPTVNSLPGVAVATNNNNNNNNRLMMNTTFPPQQTGGTTVSGIEAEMAAGGVGGIDTSETSDDMDEDDEYEDAPEESSRKRKRRGNARWAVVEAMMRQLVERQESMQRRFLEALDRRDAERVARDEAWRRQEAGRARREQELRAQEVSRMAARDSALLAFLHKTCSGGIPQQQTQQLLATLATLMGPERTSEVAPPQQVVEDHHHHAIPQDGAHGQQEMIVRGSDSSAGFDLASKRWPKPEVLALIKLRSNMEKKFQETGPKGPLWEEISSAMSCMGYSRSSKRCKEKWENINKYFRKTKDSSKKRPENSKTCPYFHQLDALYRKGVLGPGARMITAPPKRDENADGSQPGQPLDQQQQQSAAGAHAAGLIVEAADMLAIVPTGTGEQGNAPPPPVGSPSNNGGDNCFSEDEEDDDNNSSSVEKETANNNNNSNGNTQKLIGSLLDSSNGHSQQHQHHHHPTPLAMSFEASQLFAGNSGMLGVGGEQRR